MVTLSPSPRVYATTADAVTLTCMASVVDHVVVEPSLEWVFPNGSVIRNVETNVSGTLYTSMLPLESLQASQSGQYQCIARITITQLGMLTKSGRNYTAIIAKSKRFRIVYYTVCCVMQEHSIACSLFWKGGRIIGVFNLLGCLFLGP